MAKHDYVIVVRPLSLEEGGGFLAEVPALPGCMSDGETPEEAIRDARDAIEEWIAAAEEEGRAVPSPESERDYSGRCLVRMPKSLHRRLAERAELEGVSLNSLMMTVLTSAVMQKPAESIRLAPKQRRKHATA